jgi:hypothetical protein
VKQPARGGQNRTGKQMSQKWLMRLRRIRDMLHQILKTRAERL